MELVLKDAQSALTVSETTFGRDFNEALVHQVVVAYADEGSVNEKQETFIVPMRNAGELTLVKSFDW